MIVLLPREVGGREPSRRKNREKSPTPVPPAPGRLEGVWTTLRYNKERGSLPKTQTPETGGPRTLPQGPQGNRTPLGPEAGGRPLGLVRPGSQGPIRGSGPPWGQRVHRPRPPPPPRERDPASENAPPCRRHSSTQCHQVPRDPGGQGGQESSEPTWAWAWGRPCSRPGGAIARAANNASPAGSH